MRSSVYYSGEEGSESGAGASGTDALLNHIDHRPIPPFLQVFQEGEEWFMRIRSTCLPPDSPDSMLANATVFVCMVPYSMIGSRDVYKHGKVVHSWRVPSKQMYGVVEEIWNIPKNLWDGFFYGYSHVNGVDSSPTELVSIPFDYSRAGAILDLEVTEDGAVFGEEQDRDYWNPGGSTLASRLNVRYVAPANKRSFAGIRLYVRNYQYNSGWFLVTTDWFAGSGGDEKTFQHYLHPFAPLISDHTTESGGTFFSSNFDAGRKVCDINYIGWGGGTFHYSSWASGYANPMRVGDHLFCWEFADTTRMYEFEILEIVNLSQLRAKIILEPAAAPLDTFTYWRWNASVQFSGVSVNKAGIGVTPEEGLKTYAVLDAISSPPNDPTSLVGYETELGITLEWDGVLNQDVEKYNIYRRDGATGTSFPYNSVDVVKIGEVAHNDNDFGGTDNAVSYHYTDSLLDWAGTHTTKADYDTEYYYCVAAVDKTNLESSRSETVGPLQFRRAYGHDCGPSVVARDETYNLLYNAALYEDARLCPDDRYTEFWTDAGVRTYGLTNKRWVTGGGNRASFATNAGLAQNMSTLSANNWADTSIAYSTFILDDVIHNITAKDVGNLYIILSAGIDKDFSANAGDTNNHFEDWSIGLIPPPDTTNYSYKFYNNWMFSDDTAGLGSWNANFKMEKGYVQIPAPGNGYTFTVRQRIKATRFFKNMPITISCYFMLKNFSGSADDELKFMIQRLAGPGLGWDDIVAGRGVSNAALTAWGYGDPTSFDSTVIPQDEYERFVFYVVLDEWAVVNGFEFRFSRKSAAIPGASSNYIYMSMPMINYGTEVSAWTDQMKPIGKEVIDVQFGDQSGSGGGAGDTVDPGDTMCVASDTMVKTSFGEARADALLTGDVVFSWDFSEDELVMAAVVKSKIEAKETIEIELANGMKLRGTLAHRVYSDIGWQRMESLTLESKVYFGIGSTVDFSDVVGIVKDYKVIPIVKLQIVQPRNFFGNGILCHNLKDDGEDMAPV